MLSEQSVVSAPDTFVFPNQCETPKYCSWRLRKTVSKPPRPQDVGELSGVFQLTSSTCVLSRDEGLLAGGRLPHLHRLVLAPRGQPLPIRAEGHAPDAARVPLEGEGLLAGGRVPHLHGPVPT